MVDVTKDAPKGSTLALFTFQGTSDKPTKESNKQRSSNNNYMIKDYRRLNTYKEFGEEARMNSDVQDKVRSYCQNKQQGQQGQGNNNNNTNSQGGLQLQLPPTRPIIDNRLRNDDNEDCMETNVADGQQGYNDRGVVINSAADNHLFNNRDRFKSIYRRQRHESVRGVGGTTMVYEKGTAEIMKTMPGGTLKTQLINDVYYCPSVPRNLISAKFMNRDNAVHIDGEHEQLKRLGWTWCKLLSDDRNDFWIELPASSKGHWLREERHLVSLLLFIS